MSSKSKEAKKSFNLMLTPSIKIKAEKKGGKLVPPLTLSQYIEELIVFDLKKNNEQ